MDTNGQRMAENFSSYGFRHCDKCFVVIPLCQNTPSPIKDLVSSSSKYLLS